MVSWLSRSTSGARKWGSAPGTGLLKGSADGTAKPKSATCRQGSQIAAKPLLQSSDNTYHFNDGGYSTAVLTWATASSALGTLVSMTLAPLMLP